MPNPPKGQWLQFRQANAPHHYARPATVTSVQLREAVTAAIRDSGASFAEAADACWQAIDSLIRNDMWPVTDPGPESGSALAPVVGNVFAAPADMWAWANGECPLPFVQKDKPAAAVGERSPSPEPTTR